MTPAAVVGLVMAAAAAAAVGGAWVERWRHRPVEPCERHRWNRERTELVDRHVALIRQLAEAEEQLDAYRQAFPMTTFAIDRQRSVN